MIDERKEEEESLMKKNPYQLLKYINNLTKFYQQMNSNLSFKNMEDFMTQITNITEKYNK